MTTEAEAIREEGRRLIQKAWDGLHTFRSAIDQGHAKPAEMRGSMGESQGQVALTDFIQLVLKHHLSYGEFNYTPEKIKLMLSWYDISYCWPGDS